MTSEGLSATWRPDLFSGKHVVVTGATSGIGLAIAMAFAALGARVTGTATNATKAEALGTKGIAPFVADVTDEMAMKRLIETCGDLDVLVNNAGMVRRVEEFQWDTFQKVMDVNLNATARLSFLSREKLAARKGAIINIASMLSTFGDPLVPAYAASKGAVTQLTKSLAIAYAADGVRVNAIAPGWIATPLTQPLVENAERSGPIVGRTPMARWGKPDEIAEGAVFLASPAARFMTGATLTIDGGYSIR
ncbi:MAG: SDR family NAD(P)-dependent oxidoreductase [Aestuariivirga sp.]|uniref:SDR family NAD(P)-dependent oxidoreductase n=1 Tax=Aestuariivirga sp. TaxID=2650926 RepID=UPI0038D0D48D